MSRRTLDQRVHNGEVAPDDVFWFQGMSEWREVRHHPELFDDLAPEQTPPSVLPGSPKPHPEATARPIRTLEPQLIDSPAQTVHSVGHPAPFPVPPGAISLADDPALDLGAEQRTWMPDPAEDDGQDQWPNLPLNADALVPTDSALCDQPTADNTGDHNTGDHNTDDNTDDNTDENTVLQGIMGVSGDPVAASAHPTVPPDPHLDSIFADLLQGTWDHQEAHEFASCVDEVFLGAVITSALDVGHMLIDLSSDGTHHFLRFEHPNDSSRVLIRLTHLTGNLTTSRVQGHMASLMVGYGERVTGFGEIWKRLSSEARSGLVSRDQPGTMVTDGDVASQYVYAQVRLYMRIDDYVSSDWSIDHDRLRDHLTACVRALRVHLYGRLR